MALTILQLTALVAVIVGAGLALGVGGLVVGVASVVLIVTNELERTEREGK